MPEVGDGDGDEEVEEQSDHGDAGEEDVEEQHL